jgi:uncharacterized protein (DUF58 family)
VSPLLRLAARDRTGRHDRIEYKISRTGLVTLFLCIAFLFMSIYWAANHVYLLTALMWAVAITSLLYPRIMLRATRVSASMPVEVYAQTPFAVELTLHTEGRVGGAYGIVVGPTDPERGRRQYVGRIGGKQPSHHLLVRETMPERGRHWLPGLSVASSFPFGLFHARRRAESERRVLVYPRLGQISSDALAQYRGGEARWLVEQRRKDQQGDFRSLRKYAPGDNPRHVHWKTSAKMGELYVREFERREMHSALLLLDAYLPPQMPEQAAEARRERFERAVRFTATLAADLAERGVPFAFASCCPDLAFSRYDTGPGHLRDVLEILALADMTHRRAPVDLTDAVQERQVRAGGVCLITAGPPKELPTGLLSGATESVVIDVSTPEFDEFFLDH